MADCASVTLTISSAGQAGRRSPDVPQDSARHSATAPLLPSHRGHFRSLPVRRLRSLPNGGSQDLALAVPRRILGEDRGRPLSPQRDLSPKRGRRRDPPLPCPNDPPAALSRKLVVALRNAGSSWRRWAKQVAWAGGLVRAE